MVNHTGKVNREIMAPPSKHDAILKTAGDLFIAHGYTKVSIDQIAAAVPISKPTLYAHFKDKRALYSAVIENRCLRQLTTLRAMADDGKGVQETLQDIGYQFLTMVLSDSSLQMHRTLTAEIVEFPEIGALFYHSGPEQLHAFLRDYLKKIDSQDLLKVENAVLSADMFLSMIKGYIHLQCLLGVRSLPGKSAMKNRVAYAVGLFLKAHAH